MLGLQMKNEVGMKEPTTSLLHKFQPGNKIYGLHFDTTDVNQL